MTAQALPGTSDRLSRFLNLRGGEQRPLTILGAYMFLATAITTIVSAAKNGLFLSVYPGSLIPWAVLAAALVTAAVAVVFTGVIAGTARRRLAVGLTVFVAASLVVARLLVGARPSSAFALYLWLSAAQVLILGHAWDYVGDLLTGRQAKRLLPLIGLGSSLGALLGGATLAPTVLVLGTANMLLVAAGLLLLSLPLLWMVNEPVAPVSESRNPGSGAVAAFVAGASRGFRNIMKEPLLKVMAGMIIFLSLTSILVELQYKLALQNAFAEDEITAVYGLMTSLTGLGTLVLQLAASRWLFPRLGVSVAAALHAGVLAVASLGLVVFGGFLMRAALQVVDDVLQHSLQKPVEQVSLLPFAGEVKSSSVATLSGVIKPLATAAGGAVAIVLVHHPRTMALATILSATATVGVVLRHRAFYLAALERALARHSVDFTSGGELPLLADKSALDVVDRGLADADPTVVVFSLSLLEQIPAEDALPRAIPLLAHPTPEVRAEAARLVGALDLRDPEEAQEALLVRLEPETSGFVLSSLLRAISRTGSEVRARLEPFTHHHDVRVRRAAMSALGRAKHPEIGTRLRQLLASTDSDDRAVGALVVGDLGLTTLIEEVAAVVEDDRARPAALEALPHLGRPAVRALRALLQRRDLPLPLRRSLVTTLAAVPEAEAREVLVGLVDEPALGPPALTSLGRLRREGAMDPVESRTVREVLDAEVARGFRYALAGWALQQDVADPSRPGRSRDVRAFLVGELDGLRIRSLHRVLRILELCHDPERIETVRHALLSGQARDGSNALELLEGMLPRDGAEGVVAFAEAQIEGVSPDRARRFVPDAVRLAGQPLETLTNDPDWWPRSLALHALGRRDEISIPGQDPDDSPETDETMIPLIERVMILKGSQLFRYFPGHDLAGIASLAEVVHLQEDEVVFEHGDPGDAFYMVVQGGIRISRGTTELALLGPREGFGEMAILDQETRSATASASEATTLLRIDRDSFDRLIEQNPSVARGIYRVLTQRLRNTLAQVAAN